MGGLTFEKTYAIYVDFDNPGGLQTGAPVRIAGVNVGKVDEMQFRGGELDPKTGRRPMVRCKLAVQTKVQKTIHDDAEFYVTTQGVLGEQFLAIEPGSPNHPVLDPETTIPKGVGPPRLDLFFAKAYELLDMTVTGLNNNKDLVKDIATNTRDLLGGMNGALTDNRERINRIMSNLDTLTAEASTLTKNARTNYIDNPKLITTVDNIEKITSDREFESRVTSRGRSRGAAEAEKDARRRVRARDACERHRRGRAIDRHAHQEGRRHRRRPRHGRRALRQPPRDDARPEAQPVEVLLEELS
jgi:phospholipid/cholesterol/gamma-HCH transport system substrate-binding protein